jgi:hypothetical protein
MVYGGTSRMKDKKSKSKKEILTIKGLMDDNKIRWKKIKCKCAQDPNMVENIYPISKCLNCKFQESEDSVPRIPFDVIENGKTRHVTEIEIVRGKKYDDILGWKF